MYLTFGCKHLASWQEHLVEVFETLFETLKVKYVRSLRENLQGTKSPSALILISLLSMTDQAGHNSKKGSRTARKTILMQIIILSCSLLLKQRINASFVVDVKAVHPIKLKAQINLASFRQAAKSSPIATVYSI